MIVSTVISFLEDRVFTHVEPSILVLIVKVHVVAFPLPQLFALPIKVAATWTSTRVVPEENEFKNAFTNPSLVELPSISLP